MPSLECGRCGSNNVININLTVETGQAVSFFSCHACDNRWWDKGGEAIDLPEVLELAKKNKRVAAKQRS